VIFIDDFNMPQKDRFGFQPPLEILRQWIDYSGWYDREKCVWKFILDSQLMVCMAPPSGGRAVISPRTQSRFRLINFAFPADSQVIRIFEKNLSPKFKKIDDECKPLR
jgi:dynein heavy chain